MDDNERERRRRLIGEFRQTVERVDAMRAGCAVDDREALIRAAASDFVDRPDWRMRPRFDPLLVEPRRRRLDTTPTPRVDWTEIDARIAAQIASERKMVFDVVTEAVEACERAFEAQRSEVRKLEVELAQSEARITQLISHTIAKLIPPTRSAGDSGLLDASSPTPGMRRVN